MNAPAFSLVLESYNVTEGTSWERLRASLDAASAAAREDGGEVLLTDVSGGSGVANLLAEAFPDVRRVPAEGLSYDAAKMRAAEAARGAFVLYLDGDCLPERDWHRRLLTALLGATPESGVGGYTRYDGGYLAGLLSVMDFGFLYPLRPRALACYASNNSGFRRDALLAVPMQSADLRCTCYHHAQCFLRIGRPLWLVPDARVRHELPPIVRERTRQGYDAVAACWLDPALPEARWLHLGVLAAPLFYALRVWLDWKRLLWARRPLRLSWWQTIAGLPALPALRCLDLFGMVRALARGPEAGGWGGFERGAAM